MIDLSKGHIKLYIYKDEELYNNLKRKFKEDEILLKLFKRFPSARNLYYIRLQDGYYIGFNDAEFTGLDNSYTIYINGNDLLIPLIPDDLFEM